MGRRLIEKSHHPRALLDSVLPLAIENGSPVLPEIALWALNLQEGDLLMVVREDPGVFALQSYLCHLEWILDSCYEPWRFIELALRKPMGAVGPRGLLLLPDEAKAPLTSQKGPLFLRQLILPTGLFKLQRTAEPPGSPAPFPPAKAD